MAKKKTKQPQRVYLCATEWIGILRNEAGCGMTQQILDEHDSYEIFGSELLRAEVLDTGGEELLDAGVRVWVPMTRRVAVRARAMRLELAGKAGGSGKHTPDVIHVASALEAGVSAFISTDTTCREVAERFGLTAYDRPEYPAGQLSLTAASG